MNAATPATFERPDLPAWLEAADDAALDALDVGVIGFDGQAQVCRCNATESRANGLRPGRVIGQPLDARLDYVFTWRMRPVPVRLRLLAQPGAASRCVVVQRSA